MIWKDGRAARAERWRRYCADRSQWHRRFAWLPVKLNDPPSHTVWLRFYETRYKNHSYEGYWVARAVGSNYVT